MRFEDLRHDMTYAIRSFRRSPGFATVATVTLGVGIGAIAAIFSVVNAVLLEPLPYREPSRLVRLSEITPASIAPGGRERRSGSISVAESLELRTGARTLSHVSLSGGPALMTFSGSGESIRLQGQRIAPGIFDTLGVPPLMGRGFEQSGSDRSVVLSFDAWRRHFGGDPGIIGQQRTLDDVLAPSPQPAQYTIVGVMPEGFEFPDRQIEFWIPMAWHTRGSMMARLADDVPAAAAAVEVGAILRELRKAKSEVRYELVPASQADRETRSALLMLMAAAGLVLLIACANVANLLFARSTDRQHETAVRIALGASRARLIRHLLTESVLIGLCGGILGIAIAAGGVELLKNLATTLGRMDLGVQLAFPRLAAVSVNVRVLVFVVVTSVVAGILLGLAPAILHSRPRQMTALKEAARRRSGTWLVAAEVATAMVVLVGAGLLVHSFVKLSRVDPGYDLQNVLTFQAALPSERYPTDQLRQFIDSLTDRLRSIPGVQASAYGQPPLVALTESAKFRKTPEVPKTVPNGSAERRLISKDYLEVMGIRVLAGRGLTNGDGLGQRRVLLINQVLARREFSGEDPIGRLVYVGNDSEVWEVVGVVEDVRQTSIDREPGPQVFVEYRQWSGAMPFVLGPYFSIRTHVDPFEVVPQVREMMRSLDPQAGLINVATMDQLVSNRITRPRLYTALLGVFAGIAVMLAGTGIYSVTAYSVTRRTREIGLRFALGAGRRHVLALMLRQGMASIVIGLVAGLAGAAAMTKYLEGMLFGVQPLDAMTFAGVSVLFLSVATVAILLPARRAARLNALVAMRHE